MRDKILVYQKILKDKSFDKNVLEVFNKQQKKYIIKKKYFTSTKGIVKYIF